MTTTVTHAITTTEVRPAWWKASCSCGSYRSSGYRTQKQAEDIGRQHLRAKKVLP